MEKILFVFTALATISYFAKVVKNVSTPVPLLHHWDITFSNTYLSSPSIAYQCYFWANYFDIFTK